MSASVATTGTWAVDLTVDLTGHSKHSHVPSPVSPHFQPPVAAPSLTFGPIALAASVARTATTRPGSPQLLAGLEASAISLLQCLVSNSATFGLTPDFANLADSERTAFAGRCGAGVTDLYMNAMGYTWRANAACLGKPLEPHADFIYDGGNATSHGVVLAEAHGSFAANASVSTLQARADNKYNNQVKPYVNSASPYGHVIHGYCVAFGCQPGTPGAFLSLAETDFPKPKAIGSMPNAPSAPAGLVSTRMAMETHRSNFVLMGAWQVVDWIDWIIMPGEPPTDHQPVLFIRFPYAGRWYLGMAPPWPFPPPPWWHEDLWDGPTQMRRAAWHVLDRELFGRSISWFVMEETACIRFLNSLTGIIRGGAETRPERMELPTFDPVGFGIRRDFDIKEEKSPRFPERSGYDYALFRDGLALVTDPFRSSKHQIKLWSPKGGFEE